MISAGGTREGSRGRRVIFSRIRILDLERGLEVCSELDETRQTILERRNRRQMNSRNGLQLSASSVSPASPAPFKSRMSGPAGGPSRATGDGCAPAEVGALTFPHTPGSHTPRAPRVAAGPCGWSRRWTTPTLSTKSWHTSGGPPRFRTPIRPSLARASNGVFSPTSSSKRAWPPASSQSA